MFVFRVEDEYDANYLSQSFQMFQHFNQTVRYTVAVASGDILVSLWLVSEDTCDTVTYEMSGRESLV